MPEVAQVLRRGSKDILSRVSETTEPEGDGKSNLPAQNNRAMSNLVYRTSIPRAEVPVLTPRMEDNLNRLSNGATGRRPRRIVRVTVSQPNGIVAVKYIYGFTKGECHFTPNKIEALPFTDATDALSWISRNGHNVWPGLTVTAEVVTC